MPDHAEEAKTTKIYHGRDVPLVTAPDTQRPHWRLYEVMEINDALSLRELILVGVRPWN